MGLNGREKTGSGIRRILDIVASSSHCLFTPPMVAAYARGANIISLTSMKTAVKLACKLLTAPGKNCEAWTEPVVEARIIP